MKPHHPLMLCQTPGGHSRNARHLTCAPAEGFDACSPPRFDANFGLRLVAWEWMRFRPVSLPVRPSSMRGATP